MVSQRWRPTQPVGHAGRFRAPAKPAQDARWRRSRIPSSTRSVRHWPTPGGFARALLNFGVMAVLGVVLGSLLWSLVARRFRVEWFSSVRDASTT